MHRDRVLTALAHRRPDRAPADFLATPAIWDALVERLGVEDADVPAEWFDPRREAVLRALEIDCRVLSYDMFCAPTGGGVDWWGSADRSTPARMWRRQEADGTSSDVWGVARRRVGPYDEIAAFPLAGAESPADLDAYPWPEPDWWDFGPLPEVLRALEGHHVRYRIGSVFELAWQLRGMEELFLDLAVGNGIPGALMSRITDIHVENTRRALDAADGRIDLLYFYDDVAGQESLLMSPETWRREIRPHHARLVELAHGRGIPVMYHCDGALSPLIPELIDLGVDVLNPIQPTARGMEPGRLKDEFGDRLAFHGGIDIVGTLPGGTPESVAEEVRGCVEILGRGGGYVLCSSHHIQPDTPVDNVLAMYDPALRS